MHKFPKEAQRQESLIRPTSSHIWAASQIAKWRVSEDHRGEKTTTFGSLKQPTLGETFQKREKLPQDGKRELTITETTQCIVLDDQPLRVASNVGFQLLIEHLKPHYIIPSGHSLVDKTMTQMHKEVKTFIARHIEKTNAVSFTTGIWTLSHSPLSLSSLTAHWIDNEFTLQRAVLNAREFRGSHTHS